MKALSNAMNVERLKPSGDLLITDIVDGQLVKRRYSGYTEAKAKTLFRGALKARARWEGRK